MRRAEGGAYLAQRHKYELAAFPCVRDFLCCMYTNIFMLYFIIAS